MLNFAWSNGKSTQNQVLMSSAGLKPALCTSKVQDPEPLHPHCSLLRLSLAEHSAVTWAPIYMRLELGTSHSLTQQMNGNNWRGLERNLHWWCLQFYFDFWDFSTFQDLGKYLLPIFNCNCGGDGNSPTQNGCYHSVGIPMVSLDWEFQNEGMAVSFQVRRLGREWAVDGIPMSPTCGRNWGFGRLCMLSLVHTSAIVWRW